MTNKQFPIDHFPHTTVEMQLLAADRFLVKCPLQAGQLVSFVRQVWPECARFIYLRVKGRLGGCLQDQRRHCKGEESFSGGIYVAE